MKFAIKDFFSKWDKTHSELQICSLLLTRFLMENFFFVQWKTFYLSSNEKQYRMKQPEEANEQL